MGTVVIRSTVVASHHKQHLLEKKREVSRAEDSCVGSNSNNHNHLDADQSFEMVCTHLFLFSIFFVLCWARELNLAPEQFKTITTTICNMSTKNRSNKLIFRDVQFILLFFINQPKIN